MELLGEDYSKEEEKYQDLYRLELINFYHNFLILYFLNIKDIKTILYIQNKVFLKKSQNLVISVPVVSTLYLWGLWVDINEGRL